MDGSTSRTKLTYMLSSVNVFHEIYKGISEEEQAMKQLSNCTFTCITTAVKLSLWMTGARRGESVTLAADAAFLLFVIWCRLLVVFQIFVSSARRLLLIVVLVLSTRSVLVAADTNFAWFCDICDAEATNTIVASNNQ